MFGYRGKSALEVHAFGGTFVTPKGREMGNRTIASGICEAGLSKGEARD